MKHNYLAIFITENYPVKMCPMAQLQNLIFLIHDKKLRRMQVCKTHHLVWQHGSSEGMLADTFQTHWKYEFVLRINKYTQHNIKPL